LTDADIYGADFSNALLDRTMQIKLCRYADGVNTQTVRGSVGCRWALLWGGEGRPSG